MCPRENQIIRFVAGELPEAEAAVLRSHIAGCNACQQMLAQQQILWTTLADAAATPEAGDLTARILAAAASRRSNATPARIAAAVLVAIGAGVVIGSAMPVHAPPASALAVNPAAASDALGLDAFTTDQTGLAAAISAAVSASTTAEEAL